MSKAIRAWLLFGTALACLGAAQEGREIGFENETGWNSRYVWRGIVLDRKPAIQSNNRVHAGPFSLAVWNTGRTIKPALQSGSDEVDVTAAWETLLGGASVEPFLTYYSYAPSSGEPDTMEVGFGASYQLGDFTLFTEQYLDVRAASGAYYGEFGVELERDLASSWSWAATASVGVGNARFNRFNMDVPHGSLCAATGQLSLTYRWGPSLFVRPSVTYSSLLDHRLRGASETPDNCVWGICFGFAR